MSRVARSIATTLVVTAIALVGSACSRAPQPANDQGADAQAAAAQPPDLSGIWGPRFVQSLNEDPPMLPEAKQRFDSRNPDEDPVNICKPPGVPRLMNLAFPFEIVQTPKVVYFLMEYNQHIRRVYIDGKHPDPATMDPTWLGHSIGHWEGRTLVVDSIGFNEDTWLDMRGHPHSEALHVIERFTLADDGQSLQHEITIDDPKMYSKPWAGVTKSYPRLADGAIQEFICET